MKQTTLLTVAAFGGDKGDTFIRPQARPGQTISLDASASSDPDNDTLAIRWYTYPEAGTYTGKVTILNQEQTQASMTIPTDAAGKQIHVILEVKDLNPIASLLRGLWRQSQQYDAFSTLYRYR